MLSLLWMVIRECESQKVDCRSAVINYKNTQIDFYVLLKRRAFLETSNVKKYHCDLIYLDASGKKKLLDLL